MSSVVFILGAGASKQCGAPLMAEFLDVARNLWLTNAVGDKKDDFERVFKAIGALQAVHSKAQFDLTNIESIFNALEIARILRRLPNTNPEEIEAVHASLKKVIVKTLELTIKFPIYHDVLSVSSIYESFIDLLLHLQRGAFPRQTVSIITFNYDIIIEMASYKKGVALDYGMSQAQINNSSIPFLKLHGSLNWSSCSDNGEIYPLLLSDYFKTYSLPFVPEGEKFNIPIGSQIKEYFDNHTKIKVAPEPFIVPPTWNKAEHHQTLSNIWSNAAHQLSEAEHIFIIGYSLPETDAFFRLLYALGTVGKNPLERIIVYNPDQSGVVDNRFKSMLGDGAKARYKYMPLKFHRAIADIRTYFPQNQ